MRVLQARAQRALVAGDFFPQEQTIGGGYSREQISVLSRAAAVKRSLRNTRIGVIGRHPEGFDACMFSHEECAELFGI